MNIKSDSSNVLTCAAHRFTLNAMTKSALLSAWTRSDTVAAKVGQRQHTRHIRLRLQNNDILFHQFQISTYFVKDLNVEMDKSSGSLSDMSSEIYGN